tara:strand:- start:759 stop:2144 length:1386 start_codon:yes stop_codon:yes gene_type:complete
MNFSLTDYEKFSIEKLAFEDEMSARNIAETLFGSKSKKTRVQNYINHVREVRSSKTYLLTQNDVEKIAKSTDTNDDIAEEYNVPLQLVRRIKTGAVTTGLVSEEPEYYQRLVKRAQKQADLLRVERKQTRETSRVNNMLEELTGALLDVLSDQNLSKKTKRHTNKVEKASVGILHLSDLHFGEQITEIGDNVFDLNVAAARLKKFVNKAKNYFKSNGVTDILIAMTGDLVNSDRRLDEVTTNATNRASVIFCAVDILQQLILDLNEDFNVTVASVCGNESRIGKDVGWVNYIASDSFDAIIHNILSRLFEKSAGVRFINMHDPLECVVEVNGAHILLVHGHNGTANTARAEGDVSKYRAKYSTRGVGIDYVIFGHIHSAYISDSFARSSGLPGGNAYSDKALNLTSRSSQNVYLVSSDKSIDGMKIDLQMYDKNDTYTVSEAEAYKAAPKDGTVVIQSVII